MAENLPNPNDIQAWLDFVLDEKSAAVAVKNELCPPKALEEALRLFPSLLFSLIHNPAAQKATLKEAYIALQNPYQLIHNNLRARIIDHKNSDDSIFELAVGDPDWYVRKKIAGRTKSADLLGKLSLDQNVPVLESVASNIACPAETLLKLASSNVVFPTVIAKNPSTPKVALEIICENAEPRVLTLVIQHPNCDGIIREKIAHNGPFEINVYQKLLDYADKDLFLKLMDILSDENKILLIRSEYAAEDLVREMITNKKIDSSSGMFVHAVDKLLLREEISDDILLAIAKHGFYSSLAKRRNLPEKIIEIIVLKGSVADKCYLIDNPSITGIQLQPLLKDKSKNIRRSLLKETYMLKVDGMYAEFKFENRDNLWNHVEDETTEISIRENSAKLTITSALALIFESTFDISDLNNIQKDYSSNESNKYFDIAKSHSQKRKIFAAIVFRGVQLGLVEPSEMPEKYGLNHVVLIDLSVFKYLLEDFKKTGNSKVFEIFKVLHGFKYLVESSITVNSYSSSQILDLIQFGNADFNWAVAKSYTAMTEEILVALSKSRGSRHVWHSRGTPVFGRWEAFTSEGYQIEIHPAAFVAVHPDTPDAIREKLKKSSNKYIRGLFIEDERLYSNENLTRGMKDKSEYVRALVAAHPKASAEMLEKLSTDDAVEVRTAVKNNPHTPAEVKALMALMKD